MTHILLYWNHICVLHRQEKAFLQELAGRLHREDIELEVRFFGLGYPEHMSEYLARPGCGAPRPHRFGGSGGVRGSGHFFQDGTGAVPGGRLGLPAGKSCSGRRAAGDKLLPAAAIPLVYYTRELGICEQMRLPDWDGLAFGGINNSAVKTVVKVVWETWGREAASGLLDRSFVTDMPIGAFQTVRQGQARTALVPSLYALRADGQSTFLRTPQEGPVLIPSYLCARTSAPEWRPGGWRGDLVPGAVRFLCVQRGSDPLSGLHPTAQQPRGRAGLLPLRGVAGHPRSGRFLWPVL